MKTLLLVVSIFASAQTFGQIISYNDVAVIVNDNSQTSIEIGDYFQQARNIPSQNMIHIFAPEEEDIDSAQFAQMRAQIESHLINTGIADSINYLVTTKGVPLKIDGGCVIDSIPGSKCASVDSELALILGPLSGSIGVSGAINNPIYNDVSNFSRDSSGIYLVTRLEGYSKQDVFNLIDRSGHNFGINKSTAKAIVDISNATGYDSSFFVSVFTPAYDYLVNNSWNADFDTNVDPVTNEVNVFGYLGLGHGPLPSSTFNYQWTDGAVGAMTMCNSAFTFDEANNPNGDFFIADLIRDGCTGALGHVEYIFFSQIWDAEIFLSRYLDENETYNLAESYYMAEKTLSWQTVVIGDPKASVIIDNLATEIENEIEEISIYPNPSSGLIKISNDQKINSISLFDLNGKQLMYYDQLVGNPIELNLQDFSTGAYILQIEVGNESVRERILLSR